MSSTQVGGRIEFHSLVDDGFSIGFAFAAGLTEAVSSS